MAETAMRKINTEFGIISWVTLVILSGSEYPFNHSALWRSKVINTRWLIGLFALYLVLNAGTVIAGSDVSISLEVQKAYRNAQVIQAEGKMQEALSAYMDILRKYPGTPLENEILIKIARAYTQLGEDDSAISTYLKLISNNPNSTEASQGVSFLINLYSQRYRFDEVIAMSKQLVEQFPGTEAAAMALYRSAGYFYSRGEYKEAIQKYEDFLNQYKKSVMRSASFNRLISLYIREGMYEKAEQQLMAKLEKDPKDSYMLRRLALVYQKQGEYDEALELYQQILSANPNDLNVYEQMGELYAEKGDEDKAIAEWSKITESAPGEYSRHQTLAYILKSHGFYDQAAEEYKKAIELKPQISYLYTQLADLYVVKKQFGSAVDAYMDALIAFPINYPNRGTITTNMLELCEMEGLYGRAVSKLKAHLLQFPGSVPALLTLADIHFHQGNFDDSLQQFKTIAALYPDGGKTLLDHAKTLEREQQFEHAIRFYQTIFDLFPNDDISALALTSISQLRVQLQQPQAALASLQMLISSSDSQDDANFRWLPAYILTGDIHLQQLYDVQTALFTYMEAKGKIAAQPNGEAAMSSQLIDLNLRIAECYRLMGKYDMAAGVLDSIKTDGQPRSVAARIAKLRGDCSFSSGDFEGALTHYRGATQWLMNEDWVNDSLDKIAIIKEYYFNSSEALLQVHAQVERLRKLGQYSEALDVCLAAIKGEAEGIPADRIQLEIADLLALQMEPVEAVSVYKKLIQSQSLLAPEAHFRAAMIYWQQLGSPQQAIEEYSALIENYPESVLVADARKQIRRLASEQPSDNLP